MESLYNLALGGGTLHQNHHAMREHALPACGRHFGHISLTPTGATGTVALPS